jgi:hypothetical protein
VPVRAVRKGGGPGVVIRCERLFASWAFAALQPRLLSFHAFGALERPCSTDGASPPTNYPLQNLERLERPIDFALGGVMHKADADDAAGVRQTEAVDDCGRIKMAVPHEDILLA